ncbi:MAG: hypothetical protein V7785_20615 [Bermanella sp.]
MSLEFGAAQLTYLDALGIDVWVHREQLLVQAAVAVAVPETIQRDIVANDSRSVVPAPVPPSKSPMNSGFMAQASEALKTSIAPSVAAMPNVQPQEAAVAPDGQAPQQAPRFNLQFWCYSTGLWFVSSHVELLPEHHKFVHNLAQFLQGKKRRPRHVGIFSWPMIDSPNIDQGVAVAKKYLQQHMEQIQQISPYSKLIALDDAEQWLPEEGLVSLKTNLPTALTGGDEKRRIWKILQEHKIT